ncbi:MAG: RNA polymerase sigma factor [Nitrospinota bacterium]
MEQTSQTQKERDMVLVDRFKGGDLAAFEELMGLYENQIYGFLVKMCGCSEGAKDVVQNTFLNAYRYLGKFRGDAAFKTWIYKVASTSCLKEKRKESSKAFHISLDDFLPKEKPGPEHKKPSWLRTPIEELLNTELSSHLKQSLVKLPKKYRLVLVLRDLEGFTAEEASEALDISVAAVKSRLHRARLFMRKELVGYYGDRSTQ